MKETEETLPSWQTTTSAKLKKANGDGGDAPGAEFTGVNLSLSLHQRPAPDGVLCILYSHKNGNQVSL